MGKEDNKKYFTEKVEQSEVNTLLRAMAKKKANVLLWEKGIIHLTESFMFISYNDKEQYLVLQKVGGLLEKALPSQFTSKYVLFKIGLEANQQISSTGTLEYDIPTGDYHLKVGSNFYKSQQRKELRLESGAGNIIKFVCKDRIFMALDASGGGTCIPLEKSEKEFFKLGEIIPGSYLMINQKKFLISKVKILKIFESDISPDPDSSIHITGLKVTVQFLEIAESVRDDICAYITEIFKKEDLFIR